MPTTAPPSPAYGALYCHIPFCHQICPFCAFATHRLSEHNPPHAARLHQQYLLAMETELQLVLSSQQQLTAPLPQVDSIYIGGGTPSTFPLPLLSQLMDTLKTKIDMTSTPEWCMELNPEDVTPDYLATLFELGFTRLSLGLQSLDEKTLHVLGRNHSAEQGLNALMLLQQSGFENVNVDMLVGVMNIEDTAFQHQFKKMLQHAPAHVSVYILDIEPGSAFYRQQRIRDWNAQAHDQQSRQYDWAAGTLEKMDYRHYEVSNFAQPHREGRQNLLIWDGAPYLGLGVGAHSYSEKKRWHNVRHLSAYFRSLEASQLPLAEQELLTPTMQANERLMLDLRRPEGLNITQWSHTFQQEWGSEREKLVARLSQAGHAVFTSPMLRLTRSGFLLADSITAKLLVEC